MDERKKYAEKYNLIAEDYEDIDIDSALFSVRVNTRLHREGIESVGALLNCTFEKLAGIKGFGAGCFAEIHEYLEGLQKKANAEGIAKQQTKEIIPDSFFENRGRILDGDFSFLDICEDNERFVERYQVALEALQRELAEKCVFFPDYTEVLSEMLLSYSREMSREKEVIACIPKERIKNKAYYYIDACVQREIDRVYLLEAFEDKDISLLEYIKNHRKELGDRKSLTSKFIELCSYDIYSLSCAFFDEIKRNERAYEVIKKRADGQSLEQVGQEYSVTRERVRQIENKVRGKFLAWVESNNILLKVLADEDGQSLLTADIFDKYFKEYSEIVSYLLKLNEDAFSYLHYSKELGLFSIGEDDCFSLAQEYVDSLPERFNEKKYDEYILMGYDEYHLPNEIVCKMIADNYNRTGDVFHRTRLTLGKIYDDILKRYYQEGFRTYSDDEIEGFRKHILEDYGDVRLPENNRALIARVVAVGVLCNRGEYKPKQEYYVSEELAKKIFDYIRESDSPIFLTNTLYSIFEEELLAEGVTNKYYLQGILRELYEDEFVFRRDYISKDVSVTSVYTEIVGYIEKSKYPVTKRQIVEAFPGVTDIVINFSVTDPEIINLFGVYCHANKLRLEANDIRYIKNIIEGIVAEKGYVHCKDIFEYIERDNHTILINNGVNSAFGLYSIIEYLFRDELQFSRPYIGKKDVVITRTYEQLHEMVTESECILLSDILSVARENHFQVMSILEFANSCNATHLLINEKELASLAYIGVTEEIAKEIEVYVLNEINNLSYVADLQCVQNFPKLNVPWTSWLIYSVLHKWATRLDVISSSTVFKQSNPLVAAKGEWRKEDIDAMGDARISDAYVPDDIDNIDELISDLIIDEIEV